MKLFTENCCQRLLNITNNEASKIEYYKNLFDSKHFEFISNEVSLDLSLQIELDPSSQKDFENSVLIFEKFKDLNRVQANDKRLWTTLTHTVFFKYTQKRWNIGMEASSETLIRRFHFEGASLETRMRNSISRLWWAAKITYDENNSEDKYALTKLLWSKQDIYQNLVERSYGTYDSVLKGFLEFYSENIFLKEDELRKLFTALNAMGGVKVLSNLNKNEIKVYLQKLMLYYNYKLVA